MSELTHLDDKGKAHMVDVGDKDETRRRAVASARVRTRPDVIQLVADGAVPKGDVLAVARVAGIMAAKRTPELIPLCHPLSVNSVSVDLTLEHDAVGITATVSCSGRTGVEMEALTAASVAALTVYDMCKAISKDMTIQAIRLVEKTGGKSGAWIRQEGETP